MFTSITGALRRDHGDVGIYSTILGSVLFLFATIAVSSFLVVSLGATALAQANTELASKFRTEIQVWEKSSWANLENQRLATGSTVGTNTGPVVVVAGGREYKIYSRIEFNAETLTYTMTKVSQRAVTPGQAAIDCRPQLTGTVTPGCIAITGTITAGPDDVKPRGPAGVTTPSPVTVTDPGAPLPKYMKVAEIDRAKIKGTDHLRVSFVNPNGAGAGDIRIGVYCTDDVGATTINEVVMSYDNATNAYYARIGLADFDRLDYCTAVNLRIISNSDTLPTTESITPTLAVLRALSDSIGS